MPSDACPVDLDTLYRLAKRFRAAIEATPRHALPSSFESFPRGACGDASLLLAEWLRQNGLGCFDYVVGVEYMGPARFRSHAWLECEGIVADITADQFGEELPPVYIGAQSDLHRRFEIDNRQRSDYRQFDPDAQASLAAAFGLIASHILPQES